MASQRLIATELRPSAFRPSGPKPQPSLQAFEDIEDDGAGVGVIDRVPQPGAKVAVQVGITSTDGGPDFVDRTQVILEKRTGQLLRCVFPSLMVNFEIAGAQV